MAEDNKSPTLDSSIVKGVAIEQNCWLEENSMERSKEKKRPMLKRKNANEL